MYRYKCLLSIELINPDISDVRALQAGSNNCNNRELCSSCDKRWYNKAVMDELIEAPDYHEQLQRRSGTLTDRDVVAIAANDLSTAVRFGFLIP